MLIAYCLYFVAFTTQLGLFKFLCHPHCIHHLLPSDRKAEQNDKNQTFLHIQYWRQVFLVNWWRHSFGDFFFFFFDLVPWSAWTVEASHGLSPFVSVFGHWCRISQIFATYTTSKRYQSIFVQVVPDDAHPRPFQTLMSLTVDHLASCKYAQTVGASSFGLYPPLFLFVLQLLVSLH